MRHRPIWLSVCAVVAIAALTQFAPAEESASPPASKAEQRAPAEICAEKSSTTAEPQPVKPAAIAPFVGKGIAWLIAAQHPDGGWGGGSHAHQDVRDPQQVPTDPATTSFTLLSLLRAGQTPIDGDYKDQVRRGLEYLLTAVEKSPAEGPRITDITGTQPQTKLGQFVDTSLTAQYLARAFGLLEKSDSLYDRTNSALDKCLGKLQASQQKDGGWGQGGGWAPVLQSSLSCSALEIARANGKTIDDKKLADARAYQKRQVEVSADGAVAPKSEASAGVDLYAFNGAFRGNASDASEAKAAVADAVKKGALPADATVSEENLRVAGIDRDKVQVLARAAEQHESQLKRLDDEKLLQGFGNNGGEEYLSYLLTSESLVIAGGDKFNQWNDKMHGRLQKVQNADGSWSGMHCITSPVFCTAAVVQCLTTDRDATFLVSMAERTQKNAEKVAQTSNAEQK